MSGTVFTYHDLANADPLRSPAWRYQRALELFEQAGRRSARSRDDELTKELVAFLSARRYVYRMVDNQTQRDLMLCQKNEAIWSALKIFDLPESERTRVVLEARLLAGQPDDDIANSLSLRPLAVRLYHDLFFSVRDRLQSLDYIACQVIGPVFQSGVEEFNFECMLKYFGYFGGPRLIQAILYGFQSPMHPATDADMLAFLDGKIGDNLRIQTLFATTVMQPSRYDVRSLIEGYTALMALDQKIQGVDEQTDWMTSLVKTLQASLKIPRGEESLKFAAERKSSYSVGEVELRAHQQLQLANGENVPRLEQLAQFHRPDPESPVGVAPQSQ